MSESRGHSLPESHLLPDAVVAFVDAELSLAAHERAAAHIAHCPSCATDVSAQRQARKAVRGAEAPAMSAGFLANLRSIPDTTEIAAAPDNLAVTEDGQLVAVQRPDRVAGLRTGSALGSSTPLGESSHVLGGGVAQLRKRTAQGAGVVVSGLVLSALALGVTGGLGEGNQPSSGGGTQPDVLRAQFNAPAPKKGSRARTPAPSATTDSSAAATSVSNSSTVGAGQR